MCCWVDMVRLVGARVALATYFMSYFYALFMYGLFIVSLVLVLYIPFSFIVYCYLLFFYGFYMLLEVFEIMKVNTKDKSLKRQVNTTTASQAGKLKSSPSESCASASALPLLLR